MSQNFEKMESPQLMPDRQFKFTTGLVWLTFRYRAVAVVPVDRDESSSVQF